MWAAELRWGGGVRGASSPGTLQTRTELLSLILLLVFSPSPFYLLFFSPGSGFLDTVAEVTGSFTAPFSSWEGGLFQIRGMVGPGHSVLQGWWLTTPWEQAPIQHLWGQGRVSQPLVEGVVLGLGVAVMVH